MKSLRYGILLLLALLATGLVLAQDEDQAQRTMTHDGVTRSYYLHLPAAYDGTQPAPLVVVLHGAGGTGQELWALSGLSQLSDETGSITLYPDAIDRRWSYLDEPVQKGAPVYDDAGFITSLIDRALDEFNIDTGRLYVMGYSNGGLMAARMRCELSDRLAGVAIIGATMTFKLAEECMSADPVPYVMVLGTHDQAFAWEGYAAVTEDGGWLSASFSAAQTVSFEASLNRCYQAPIIEDVTYPGSTLQVVRQSYGDCESSAPVVLYALVGAGHVWPSYVPVQLEDERGVNVIAAAWQFMTGFKRDQGAADEPPQ